MTAPDSCSCRETAAGTFRCIRCRFLAQLDEAFPDAVFFDPPIHDAVLVENIVAGKKQRTVVPLRGVDPDRLDDTAPSDVTVCVGLSWPDFFAVLADSPSPRRSPSRRPRQDGERDPSSPALSLSRERRKPKAARRDLHPQIPLPL